MKLITTVSLFCLFVLCSFSVRAQCAIDFSLTAPGLSIDTLPPAVLGEPYYQVVQIVMPRDTVANLPVLGDIHAYFCTFGIKEITNEPVGMTYEVWGPTANQTTDTWTVNHITPGYTNRGCVEIKGTPQSDLTADNNMLKIVVKHTESLSNPANNSGTCNHNPLLPTSTDYELFWMMHPVSIDVSLQKELGLKLMPNPADRLTSLKMELPKPIWAEVGLYDLAGKKISTVFEGMTGSGTQLIPIGLETLAGGLYFVRLTTDNRSATLKLMVQP